MTRRILMTAMGLAAQTQEKEFSADGLKELEKLETIDGHVNIPMSQLEARISGIPRDVLIVAG